MTTEQLSIPEPIIFGAAGDIGRTTLQQCLEQGIVPAGVVLTDHRLKDEKSMQDTADEMASNFTPNGEERVLEDIELGPNELRIDGYEIPVFTPASQHEILAEGHPVIDATGKNTKRDRLEELLEAGASFVVVTSPIKQEQNITAVVYGVNSTDERMGAAAEDRLLSTSSCTTTAVSSTLGPLLPLGVTEATVHVSHARTKSNDPTMIENNIITSGSGAAQEIPKILGIGKDTAFDLACIRANAACGSMFNMALRLKNPTSADVGAEIKAGTIDGEAPGERIGRRIKEQILTALDQSESVYLLDDTMKDTKRVIGVRESVAINPDLMSVALRPDGTVVANITGFYDNVSGYTASMLRGYVALSKEIARSSTDKTPEAIATS